MVKNKPDIKNIKNRINDTINQIELLKMKLPLEKSNAQRKIIITSINNLLEKVKDYTKKLIEYPEGYITTIKYSVKTDSGDIKIFSKQFIGTKDEVLECLEIISNHLSDEQKPKIFYVSTVDTRNTLKEITSNHG